MFSINYNDCFPNAPFVGVISNIICFSTPVLFWGVYGYSEHSYNCGLDLGEGIHRLVIVYCNIVHGLSNLILLSNLECSAERPSVANSNLTHYRDINNPPTKDYSRDFGFRFLTHTITATLVLNKTTDITPILQANNPVESVTHPMGSRNEIFAKVM